MQILKKRTFENLASRINPRCARDFFYIVVPTTESGEELCIRVGFSFLFSTQN